MVQGNGLNGQLGLPAPNTFQSSLLPKMVVRHQSVREIGCGGNFSVCLLDTGAVFTWGSPEYGQLGHDSFTDIVCQPRQVKDACCTHTLLQLTAQQRLSGGTGGCAA